MIVARANKPSRGLTVIAVLVCLIVLTIVSGAVLKVGFARRELARAQERRLQADWLVESGVRAGAGPPGPGSRLPRRDVVAGGPRPGPGRTSAGKRLARPLPYHRRPSSRSRSSARPAIRSAVACAFRRTIPPICRADRAKPRKS